jgi:pimeloyl-ACP methyl ester carboxylesterase
MATGDFGRIAQIIHDGIRSKFGRFHGGMSAAMDSASGITAQRLKLVEEQARTSLLGDALNFPMPQLAGAYRVPDLGDDFRAPVTSTVPTLFLSGTLDGRTYPESAAETASRFSQATHVLIENSGHNLFMVSPEVTEVILTFLDDNPIERTRIVLPTPAFIY